VALRVALNVPTYNEIHEDGNRHSVLSIAPSLASFCSEISQLLLGVSVCLKPDSSPLQLKEICSRS